MFKRLATSIISRERKESDDINPVVSLPSPLAEPKTATSRKYYILQKTQMKKKKDKRN